MGLSLGEEEKVGGCKGGVVLEGNLQFRNYGFVLECGLEN